MFLSALRHLRCKSAELRSHSDSFHEYANKTPLKLSYSAQVIIMEENEWANYCETVRVFAYVSACGMSRCRHRRREREGKRCLMFCLFGRKPCLRHWTDFQECVANISLQPGSYVWDVISLFLYDTTFQSFCQGDKDLMLSTILLSRVFKEKSSHWYIHYGVLYIHKEKCIRTTHTYTHRDPCTLLYSSLLSTL